MPMRAAYLAHHFGVDVITFEGLVSVYNILFHCYKLDEFICHFRLLMINPVKEHCRSRSESPLCGI